MLDDNGVPAGTVVPYVGVEGDSTTRVTNTRLLAEGDAEAGW